jgi:diaminopropionate ammonia-lyase
MGFLQKIKIAFIGVSLVFKSRNIHQIATCFKTEILNSMTVANDPTDTKTWYSNPYARNWSCDAPAKEVARFHKSLPNYSVTPLIELPTIAAELGVGRVFIKDESARMNLSAFKILGAAWAVAQALTDGANPADIDDVKTAIDTDNKPTLVAATDGNHGRAVAHMAMRLGLECTIVIPDGVSEQAINNIAGEGAEITIIDGNYDEAVELAKEITSTLDNAIHIQDMSWPGYEQIPSWIIEGYTTLCAETDDQLRELGSGAADLVAAPVGVGAFLHSVLAHYRSQPGRNPVVLSVEAIGASCVLQSLKNGELTSVDTVPTIMAGMNCGTPSSDSWPTHQAGVDAAVALTDDETRLDLKVLSDLGVDSGPCGAATLSGVRKALSTQERRSDLGITNDSVIVLFSTEGRAANPLQ